MNIVIILLYCYNNNSNIYNIFSAYRLLSVDGVIFYKNKEIANDGIIRFWSRLCASQYPLNCF